MFIISFFLFGIFPFIVALVGIWGYNILFPLDKIKSKAQCYDSEKLPLPGRKQITLKELRESNKIGEKVVYCHYLVKKASDFRRAIWQEVLPVLVVEAVIVVVFSIGAASEKPEEDLFKNIDLILKDYKLYFLFPVGMILYLIKNVFHYIFLSNQFSDYEDI